MGEVVIIVWLVGSVAFALWLRHRDRHRWVRAWLESVPPLAFKATADLRQLGAAIEDVGAAFRRAVLDRSKP